MNFLLTDSVIFSQVAEFLGFVECCEQLGHSNALTLAMPWADVVWSKRRGLLYPYNTKPKDTDQKTKATPATETLAVTSERHTPKSIVQGFEGKVRGKNPDDRWSSLRARGLLGVEGALANYLTHDTLFDAVEYVERKV